MPVVLRKALLFIGNTTEVADKRNPAVIESMTKAIRVIAEIKLARRCIEARIEHLDLASLYQN